MESTAIISPWPKRFEVVFIPSSCDESCILGFSLLLTDVALYFRMNLPGGDWRKWEAPQLGDRGP